MEQYIISSFISKKGGGNKAAVVLDDNNLTEMEMLNRARENNLSETAFINIKESDEENFSIRYFTPTEEVDICGHAALASFHLLDTLGYIGKNEIYHKTNAGRLKVIRKNGLFFIQMKPPEISGYCFVDDITEITTLKKEEIIPNNEGNISIVSTGLKDAIIEVVSLEVLKGMSVNKEKMINFCREKNIIGAHIVSRETIEEDSDFACRNFAPAVGIDEESATGTSNASFIYYIINECKKKIKDTTYKIEQGYFMGSASNIYVYISRKEKTEIFVGGKATILETLDV